MLPGLMTAGFGVALGMRSVAGIAGVAAALVIVSGLARASAGVFVLDPLGDSRPPSFSEWIHNAAGTIYIVTLILAVLAWFVALRTRRRPPGWFAWYSLVTAVAAIAVPFALIGTGLATTADVGLFQRASFGVLNVWILVLAATESRS